MQLVWVLVMGFVLFWFFGVGFVWRLFFFWGGVCVFCVCVGFFC